MSETIDLEEIRQAAISECKKEITDVLAKLLEEIGYPAVIISQERNPEEVKAKENLLRYLEAHKSGSAMLTTQGARFEPGPLPEALRRLLWLLGLSLEERAFVCALAAARNDQGATSFYLTLLVFADWLAEAGRQAEAGAVASLCPADGDVILLWANVEESSEESLEQLWAASEGIEKHLASVGKNVYVRILREGVRAEIPASAEMRRMGWVRQADVREEREADGREIDSMRMEIEELKRQLSPEDRGDG